MHQLKDEQQGIGMAYDEQEYNIEYLHSSFAGSFYEPAKLVTDHGDKVTITFLDPFLEEPVTITTTKDRIRF